METQIEPSELDKEKKTKSEESIAKRIKLRKQKSDEQPDTTDMFDLGSEESAAQRTNNSENSKTKLDNYCILCIHKKNLQKISIEVWLTLFIHGNNLYNTENSKTNESNKFIFQFTDKLNLKTPNNKNTGLIKYLVHLAKH